MNFSKTSVLLVLLVLFTLACNRHRVPKGFPKPDEMAEILTELHIVENTLTYSARQTATGERNIPGNYKFVLQRYDLTPAEFDTIRKWYANHPDLYQDVYEKVLSRLSEKEADIRIQIEREREKEILLEEKQRELERIMDKNLWTDSTSIIVQTSDTINKNIPFSIDVDTLNLSGSVKLTAFYRFLKEDLSQRPQIMLSAFYPDSTADTIYKRTPHSFQKTGAELELALQPAQAPEKIYGYLLLQDSLLDVSVEINDIILQNRPLLDSLQVSE